jgi:hypothetical protein
MFRLFILVAAATLAAACALAAPGRAATVAATCGEGAYAYAGIGGRELVSGVSARIAPTAAPTVRDGHVDGWVGVGGPGAGPNGADEWIQVGLTSVPNEALNSIYYEIVRPGHADVTHWLRANVRVGEQHTFAVREMASRPNAWRVWLDGSPASPPVFLPSSHARWTAQAVGESWAGTTSGPCNTYAYSFGNVAFASVRDGGWSPFRRAESFQDANYRLVRQSPTSFLAHSVVVPQTRITAVAGSDRGDLPATPISIVQPGP